MRTSVSGNTRNPSSAVLLRCKQKLLLSGGVFFGGGGVLVSLFVVVCLVWGLFLFLMH